MIQRFASATLRLLAGAAVIVQAGCAVGPNFQRPAAPNIAGYRARPMAQTTVASPGHGGEAQRFVAGADLPSRWWTLFNSSALDALMDRAIAANPDLESAKAALRQAQENVKVQRAGLFPTAALSAQASREKDSNALSPTLANPISMFSLYTAQLAISYSPDVFGGVRRGIENAAAQAEQQRYEYEAAYLTVTTNVAAAAIQEANLRGQIGAVERLVTIQQDLLKLYSQEKALGQLAQADVALQDAALAQNEALLLPLRRQLAQTRDLITALTGHLPSEEGTETFRLSDLTLPTDLPVSLPSQLVDQRPDIRAAEANLHAASAAVGIAVANRLPSITLSATGGGASTSIGDLLAHGNEFWTLAGGFTQPIFDAGALRHKQRAAEAAYDQARAQYRSTVLSAFQNVADTLKALEIDAEALRAADAAERASAQSLAIARGQQRLGQSSSASVLIVEQAYQTAVQAKVQVQAARYNDTVALFQALGGGWSSPERNIQVNAQ
jgi:NodT family efflux transporter outer membrane factor (OMF) lipoprotein